MNWTFNQDCQLIIDELPIINDNSNVVEILFGKYDGSFKYFINRKSPLIYDIEQDGIYKYLCIPTDRSISELKNLLLDPDSFLQYLVSPANSFGFPTIEEEIFSICHLRKCAILLEKQAIEEFLSTCDKKNCNKKSSQQSTRDILLISVFVLEHLIARHKYSEAENILERLSSCKNICEDSITKTHCCNG